MTAAGLKVAVVGHTNTGKTSLMRTLMRDVEFGEVSDRPAVTREVEAAVLRAGGRAVVDLYDTPGLEDSIGLLEHLDALRGGRRVDGIDVIGEFLEGAEAQGRFRQEAKAIRQVLLSDVALYVIDARDRVLAKHRDELEILGRCARPVVPVLNFTAGPDARTVEWRAQLSRVNMHAAAEFDTVVFDAQGERRLFEKMRTLVDAHAATIDALLADRAEARTALVASSAAALAELLIDAAAYTESAPAANASDAPEMLRRFREKVRQREQQCVEELLVLHRFRPGDVAEEALPLEDGRWGLDLFSPEAVKQFGVSAGGAAAVGALVGLTLDVMLAGLSLGTGTMAGAAVGGAVGAARMHGRRLVNRLRGLTELRCDDVTLRLLAGRQTLLVRALLRRGHAAVNTIHLEGASTASGVEGSRRLMQHLGRARGHPHWSALSPSTTAARYADPARHEALQRLADLIRTTLMADVE